MGPHSLLFDELFGGSVKALEWLSIRGCVTFFEINLLAQTGCIL